MKLYEIKQEYDNLLVLAANLAEANDGVIPDELAERMDEIDDLLEQKILNCALAYKNCMAEADAIFAEEKNLVLRRKSAENKADWLKGYISSCLPHGETFKTAQVAITRRKSDAVEISDESAIPDVYCKIARFVNKTTIKTAIKAGQTVAGAKLVERHNLQIK